MSDIRKTYTDYYSALSEADKRAYWRQLSRDYPTEYARIESFLAKVAQGEQATRDCWRPE